MKYVLFILVFGLARVAFAVPIDSIHATNTSPITARGGVLMVPLYSTSPGDNWPSTCNVLLDDGTTIIGQIGWIEQNKKHQLRWSDSLYSIRPVNVEDDTSQIHPKDASSGPVLLAQMPEGWVGTVTVGSIRIDPIWVELPSALPSLNLAATNTSKIIDQSMHDATSLDNPLEYWRVTLLASRRGVSPFPLANEGSVQTLAAMRGAQIWRVALNNLATHSRGVAASCRDLLTNTGLDGDTEFACWVTGTELNLLSTLLDTSLSPDELVSLALTWCEEQQSFIYWLEQVYGEEVVLTVVNPTLESMLIAIRWREGNDIPIAVELNPRETMRIPIRRNVTKDLSMFGPTTDELSIQWLDLQMGNHVFGLPIVPDVVVAQPPAVQLPPLYPTWTLQSVRRHAPNRIPSKLQTIVQVRKIFGKWEFFVSSGAARSLHTQSPAKIVFYHAQSDSTVELLPKDLTITEYGWKAEVDVPLHWIDNDELAFSTVLYCESGQKSESSPLPRIPWGTAYPSSIVIDLSQWDAIQQFPESR